MTNSRASRPRLGVIEGFYGQPWGMEARFAMADWLPALGIEALLYAPKADRWLRRGWREAWPRESREALGRLSQRASSCALDLGIGLSPFGIYRHYGAAERRALRDRVEVINDFGAPLLALLFDDMPGDVADLAQRQAEVAVDVAHWSAARELLLCPTYYSEDPVLDRVFGARPEGYLAELAGALPDTVSLFWTGRQVCSETVACADLPPQQDLHGNTLALWDNYPVNDSRARSEHIYVQPFSGRDPALAGRLRWHWSNAMNQPALSLPALASLAALYGAPVAGAETVLQSAGVGRELLAACAPLATAPRDALDAAQRSRLEACAKGPGRAARELLAFLRGDYRFDPECLTD